MKRKQKVPRRLRRPPSLKPADNAEKFVDPILAFTEENPSNDQENFKIALNDLSAVRKISPSKVKEPEEKTIKNTEKGDLDHVNSIERQHQESEVALGDQVGNRVQNLKQISNPIDNISVPRRDLKRTLNPSQRHVNVSKNPKPFVNLRNGQEGDDNMPVILNVFSLSEESDPHSEQKITRLTRTENNFPVTPPCSPPLVQHEQFAVFKTVQQNGNYHTGLETSFPLSYSLMNYRPTNESNGVYNTSSPIGFDKGNVTNGLLCTFPNPENQIIDQRKNTVQDSATRSYDVNGGIKIPLLETQGKDGVTYSTRILTPNERFVPQQNKQFAGLNCQKEHDISERHRLPLLLELLQQDNFAKYERLNNNNERVGLGTNAPSFAEKNGLLYNNTVDKAYFRENGTELLQHNCNNFSLTTSDTGESKNTVSDNHVFLSPRDIRVMQLKKRLQEQEATLKKLRTNN